MTSLMTGGTSTSRSIALDWGSSNFRAFLIQNDEVQMSLSSEMGVKRIERKEQYPEIIASILTQWKIQDPSIPIIISGMAGSISGWVNTGYMQCPLPIDSIGTSLIPAPPCGLDHPIYLCAGVCVPGISGHYDVMRGEEIQILGALQQQPFDILVLPGTHSKWCHIDHTPSGTQLTSFTTTVTGEVYELLSKQSLLCTDAASQAFSADAFVAGLDEARTSASVIRSLFSTRAKVILQAMAGDVSASYLSGILIGDELKNEIADLQPDVRLGVIASPHLADLYRLAFSHYGCSNVTFLNASDTTTRGYAFIINQVL